MVQCWAVDKKIKQRISVAEMKMLRYMTGVSREVKIRNEYVERSVGIALIMGKMKENRLKWSGYVTIRENSEAIRTAR